MEGISRRFLLAGGAGTVGAVVGLNGVGAAAAATVDNGWIDLGQTPDGVVPGDKLKALHNTRAINTAIEQNPADVRLVLPAGTIYVERDPVPTGVHRFAAIKINGTNKRSLTLSGRGRGVTRIVMIGSQSVGLTQIIQVADGPNGVTLCDFSIEHGPEASEVDSEKLRNHQIELNAQQLDVTGTEIRDVDFGTCIGDAIRLAGGEGATTSTLLRNTTIRNITMRLGKHPGAPDGCRSGVSFQKGIRDLLLTDFSIEGPKNSPLDMEPTAHAGMDNITIANGTIDNTKGKTWIAMSFDGFEDNGNVTSFLTHSRVVNVKIRGGQLQVISTRGCTIDNVVIEASSGTPDATDAPMLVVYRANEDLTINNVNILRDTGCPPGPLVTVQHAVTSPKRINISGGTWTTKVSPGKERSYVDLLDVSGLWMNGTRIRTEEPLTGMTRTGIRMRPGHLDMSDLHFDGVTIESPDGLTNGFAFAAVDKNMRNISVTGCTVTGAATNAIHFSAFGTFTMDRFPILQANDFGRSTNPWVTDQAVVFPIIAGNRGGPNTMAGTLAPEGNVAAVQGSQYIRRNGNAPELWWKATGIGPTGWKKLA
jgi:hypothetical protein